MTKQKFRVDFSIPENEQQLKEIALRTIRGQEKQLIEKPLSMSTEDLWALAMKPDSRRVFLDSLEFNPNDSIRIDRLFDDALMEHQYGPRLEPSEKNMEPGAELASIVKKSLHDIDETGLPTALLGALIQHSTQSPQIERFIEPPEFLDGGQRFIFRDEAVNAIVRNTDLSSCRVDLLEAWGHVERSMGLY